MILKIARMGHPVLRKRAAELTEDEIRSGFAEELAHHMIETMHEYTGVGLAAPQVHISKRMVVVDVPAEARGSNKPIPCTVLVNPVVKTLGNEEMENWEGCLSVPGLIGLVQRPMRVRVEYLTAQGNREWMEVEGFPAAVIQHECDHLDGILYIERMRDMKKLSYTEEFARYNGGER